MLADFIPLPPGKVSVISTAAVVDAVYDVSALAFLFPPVQVPAFVTRSGNALYLIDSISFAGGATESDYVASVDSVDVPAVQLRSPNSAAGAADTNYPAILLTRYFHDLRQRTYYSFNSTKTMQLNFLFKGKLKPGGSFPTSGSVRFTFAATIYVITDQKFISDFFNGTMRPGNL